MIQWLDSYKNGNIIIYSISGNKKEINNIAEVIKKNDEFSIIREIETETVSKSFGNFGYRDITIKSYPYKSEAIYDKDGNIISKDFFKNDVEINVITEKTFLSGYDGIYKTFEELPDELKDTDWKDRFKDENLIVASYLSSSGSNYIYSSNAYYDNILNITHIVKIAEIGTCDIKVLTTYTFVPKNISNEYIVRFIEEDMKNIR